LSRLTITPVSIGTVFTNTLSIRLFADDTKLWTRITGPGDNTRLQQDLNRLQQWSDEWLLPFNINKCKVMHVGHNGNDEYFLQEEGQSIKLEVITEEKDLGVFVTANTKPSKQCVTYAAIARSVLGLMHRHFREFSKEQFLAIYIEHTFGRIWNMQYKFGCHGCRRTLIVWSGYRDEQRSWWLELRAATEQTQPDNAGKKKEEG
jgi:hypothetical protein